MAIQPDADSAILKLLLAFVLAIASGFVHAEAFAYEIDPSHTFVTFEIDHFHTSTNRGRFDRKQGRIQFDRVARNGSLEITIDMASINTGTVAFDKFLQGFQMFDVATYPTAQFVSDQLGFSGDDVDEVTGKLTMLGKTHEVVLKARRFNCYRSPLYGREVCGGDFEGTIDRTEWGIDYGLIFGFPRQVRLLIQVEAIRQ